MIENGFFFERWDIESAVERVAPNSECIFGTNSITIAAHGQNRVHLRQMDTSHVWYPDVFRGYLHQFSPFYVDSIPRPRGLTFTDRKILQTDVFLFMLVFDGTLEGIVVPRTTQQLIPRLTNTALVYSPLTVALVNRMANQFTTRRDYRSWLETVSGISWIADQGWLVPARLRIRENEFSQRKKYWFTQSVRDSLRSLTMGVVRPVNPARVSSTAPQDGTSARAWTFTTLSMDEAMNAISSTGTVTLNIQPNDTISVNPSPRRAPPMSADLHPYNERATSFFPFLRDGNSQSNLFFGLELEYENADRDRIIKTKRLLKDIAILKRDGSVSSGFEICSAPAHYKVLLDGFKKFFAEMPDGLESRSNCGMHVHLSRDAFSFLQLGKIMALLNNEENERPITVIAGRAANNYCRRLENVPQTEHMSFPWRVQRGNERYQRVNLQNQNTIEFRMFSTPTTYDDYSHKLQFCKAVADFTNPGIVSTQQAAKFDIFANFVTENRKSYPQLFNKITSI